MKKFFIKLSLILIELFFAFGCLGIFFYITLNNITDNNLLHWMIFIFLILTLAFPFFIFEMWDRISFYNLKISEKPKSRDEKAIMNLFEETDANNKEKNVMPTITFYKDTEYNPVENYKKIKLKKEKIRTQNIEIVENEQIKQDENLKYKAKSLLTDTERYFYKIIKENFGDKFLIQAQVNLAAIIEKIKDFPKQYQNELYRNIDFGIFDKDDNLPLLLIEINDSSHGQPHRKIRDYNVKQICKEAKIKLIKFYTMYSNKESYIVERIQNELN